MQLDDLTVRLRGRLRGLAATTSSVGLGDGRLLVHTRYGHRLFLDAADTSLTPMIALRGSWEPGVTRLVRRLVRSGQRVVEIGANIGWFTVQTADLVGARGSIVAFEPNPRAFELLHLNVFTNGLWPRCRLEPAAVADRSGSATLHVAGSFLGSGRLTPFRQGDLAWHGQAEHSVKTRVMTLDEAVADDPCVHLLKIDAEGAEPAILDGAAGVLAANPSLRAIIEYHPDAHGLAFLDRLTDLGFNLKTVDRWGRCHRVTSPPATSVELYCERIAV